MVDWGIRTRKGAGGLKVAALDGALALALAFALALALALVVPAGTAFGAVASLEPGVRGQACVVHAAENQFEGLAESSNYQAAVPVEVSAENASARMAGVPFALVDFVRMEKGSNRPIDGSYRGYSYLMDAPAGSVCLVDAVDFMVVYVPPASATAAGFDLTSQEDRDGLKDLLAALDQGASSGNRAASSDVPWFFTSEAVFTLPADEAQPGRSQALLFSFEQEYAPGQLYVSIAGADGSDVTAARTDGLDGTGSAAPVRLSHMDTASLQKAESVAVAAAPTALESLGAFFATLDFSPLWVTLKTGFTAIVLIFVLGVLAAWWSLRLPRRAQDVVDAILTIPLVLPPTVCGFLLLLCLGSNTPVGAWFDQVGFPLVFSWPATVIAAVVVAFPLMYRSARGAFESLEPDMLDAARTLGWGEGRIFLRLMMPLAWSSIAAGTMLAFARALGEFGATLFLAGNYVGITRTIPIAIYFEWMSGNVDVALFWTVVVMSISFVAVFAINCLSRRANRYRNRVGADERAASGDNVREEAR